MVRFTRLPAFLSLAVLATMFLSYSVESAADEGKMKCKHSSKTMKYPKESMKTVIVILKPGAHQHEKWLKDCWNIRTVPADHSQGVSSLSEEDDVAVNFSVEGEESVNGYFVKVPLKFFKEQIVPRDDVDVAEEDGLVKINYAVPQLTKRTTVVNPLPNLDRIDQARLPLDKKYIFPNSAGKGVNVFIVDTGIDIKHVQFEGRARIGGRFCTGPGCNTDRDDHGHGSHVAGTVGGKTVGVARKVNLIAVKVLDATGHGSFAGIIDGLQFVLAQHKKSKNKNSVVNMSLGGGLSDAINKVVQSLVKAGIHVVVAAGNDHQDACNTSPASAPGAVTVAALENTSDQLTDFSNFGRCVNIVGPGRNVLSVGANTHNKFAVFSGTSQATPHVAGTIALIIAKQGNQSPAKMVKTLDNLSTKNVIKQSTLLGTPNRLVRVPKP